MIKGQARLWELESKAASLGSAQSLVYDIRNLPKGHRVAGFLLVGDFDVTTAGATGRRPVDAAGLLFDFVEHSSDFFKLRATGYGLGRLFHAMHGKALANKLFGNAIGKGRAPVWIPLSDPRAKVPHDTAIPTELLNNTQIELKTTAATAVNLFGAAAVASCSYRLFASLVEGAGPVDPSATRIDFEDWAGQTINLKSGVFTHALIYKDRTDTSTDAADINPDTEITRMNFTHNGAQISNNILSWAQILEYNRSQVAGGSEDNDAEQVDDTSTIFMPVFTPPNLYSIPQLPGGPQPNTQLQLSGSLTQVRVLYRQVTYKDTEQVRNAAAKFGVLNPNRSLKTASKMDIAGGSNAPADVARRSEISKLIPGRLSEA